MKKKSSALFILIVLSGFLQEVCGEDAKQTNSPPVIVVQPLGGSRTDVPDWQPVLGQGISEMLIETLEGSDKKFQVLETPEATSSQSEVKSGAPDSTGGGAKSVRGGSAGSKAPAVNEAASSGKPDAVADAGSPADSDFTFCGEVTQFTVQTSGSKIGDFISSSPFANVGAKVSTAHIQIQWRLVDSETKKVVKRGITACSASGSDFDMTDLTTPDGKAAVAGSAAAFTKTTAGGKRGTNNYANIFSGLILGNASSGTGGGDNAGSSKGTNAKSATAKSTRAPAQAAPAASGDSAGNNSRTAAQSANTSSQTVTKAGGDVAAAAPESETISYGNPAFMDSALGKATAKAVNDIIKQLDATSLPEPGRVTKVKTVTGALRHTPGTVLAVASKDTIIVSLGSKEGFKEGDTLELYQLNDVKDDKGNVVFTDEKLVGEITLQAVQDDKSRASYSGDAQVQQGWTVKAK